MISSGRKPFECGDQFGRGRDVPDINAEADDFRVLGQQRFRNFDRRLMDVEFEQRGARPEFGEIGQQIAQAERGMDIFRVERCQDNVGHTLASLAAMWPGEQCNSLNKEAIQREMSP